MSEEVFRTRGKGENKEASVFDSLSWGIIFRKLTQLEVARIPGTVLGDAGASTGASP